MLYCASAWLWSNLAAPALLLPDLAACVEKGLGVGLGKGGRVYIANGEAHGEANVVGSGQELLHKAARGQGQWRAPGAERGWVQRLSYWHCTDGCMYVAGTRVG